MIIIIIITLKENEIEITDINHLIYAAATVITEKVTKLGKTIKSRRNKNFWKIRIEANKQLEKRAIHTC
jgi:hypothetical protein